MRAFENRGVTISLQEELTPESVAMKYVVRNLGLNIRPSDARYDKENNQWIVKLNALVPNHVFVVDKPSKNYLFKFKNIGRIILDDELTIIEKPTAKDVDDVIYKKFFDTHKFVEEEILTKSKHVWGKLPYVQVFLRPLYSITLSLLTEGSEKVMTLENLGYWKWARLLLECGFIRYDDVNPQVVVPSNTLIDLNNRILEQHDQLHTAVQVVGSLFAEKYSELLHDLNIYGIAPYLELPRTYYIDAVEYGENIYMDQRKLERKYLSIGRRYYDKRKAMIYKSLLAETVSAGILHKKNKNVYGNNDILEPLLEQREAIMAAEVSIF